MEAEYKRDTHHSYLVLFETEEKSRESFQRRMFLENTVPGFLPCRMYDVDCSGRFFYDISSRQSLVNILETGSMDRGRLETLLTSILRALNGLQNYLLDVKGFCLRAEWIFSNPTGTVFEFCYFPEGDFIWKDQLQQLSEYLLPHLEHKNREAVRLGYSFYQYVMEDKITATELEKLLLDDREETEEAELKGKTALAPAIRAGDRQAKESALEEIPASRDALLNAFFEEPEMKTSPKSSLPDAFFPLLQWIIPILSGGIGTFLFWFFRYDRAAIVCMILTAITVFFLLLRRWKLGREKERDETMEQYVVVQDWLEEEKQEEELLQEKSQSDSQEFSDFQEGATCLLTSEAVYQRLAKGYLVPDESGEGRTIPINKEVTMIGKSSQMDVVLKGLGISRIHARISCRGEQCYISDMNSRNGTKLNGTLLKPEEEQLLSDGDRITFANMGFEWNCYRL